MRSETRPRRNHFASAVEIKLPFMPPYDWRAMIRFYRSHLIPGVERVVGDTLTRVFRLENKVGFVQVRALVAESQLALRVVPEDSKITSETARRVRKMFDLDCDPALIARSFEEIPLLARLCRRYPGLRVAHGWDPFETAICSILGQLVSAGRRENLIRQLVSNYGEQIVDPSTAERTYLFPCPEVLASADLREVRTTMARREAIRDFSRRVLNGAISLSEGQDPFAFRQRLRETDGVGPWSAEYISLRAVGENDAFPKTDLILKRVLELHPDLDLERVKPWRSYAAVYLWKEFAQTLSRAKGENKHDAIL